MSAVEALALLEERALEERGRNKKKSGAAKRRLGGGGIERRGSDCRPHHPRPSSKPLPTNTRPRRDNSMNPEESMIWKQYTSLNALV